MSPPPLIRSLGRSRLPRAFPTSEHSGMEVWGLLSPSRELMLRLQLPSHTLTLARLLLRCNYSTPFLLGSPCAGWTSNYRLTKQ